MSANNLQRRIDRLITHIDKQISQPPARPEFDFSLFPIPEQTQLRLFLTTIEHHVEGSNSYTEFLDKLTEQQLYIIWCWHNLEEALAKNDMLEATRQREMINTSDEELLYTFLHLNISVLPAHHSEPGPQEQIGNCTYTYTRLDYRHLTMLVEISGIARHKDDLWRWVHFLKNAA